MERFWKGLRVGLMAYVGWDMWKVIHNTICSWKAALDFEHTDTAAPWSVVVYKTVFTLAALGGYIFLVYLALFM